MASSSSSAGTEEVEKHILRKYEICQKLGKGVRSRLPARAFAVLLPLCLAHRRLPPSLPPSLPAAPLLPSPPMMPSLPSLLLPP